MDESQEDLSLDEFNLIDNIIESAVDELLLKKNSVRCVGLFAQVCRLCACDDQQMMHISDVHLQIIYDLQIPGINESSGCTNICSECNGFLEEFCKFRSQCEEGQKRIAAMLGERKICTKKSRANKISSTVVKAVIKEPKRAESRRRVVDGHLQWVCLDCEQVFKSCMRLKKHRRTCVLVGSERSKRFGTNVCDLCGAVLSSTLAFKLHRRAHESATDTSCKQQLSSTQLEPFVCHVCGNLCKSSRVLRLHLLTHNAERNVECNICGKQFKRKRSLRVHLQVHSGTKFECEICSKKFLTTVTLSKHMKTHRIDYLKHSCTMCPKRFALLRQLQKHMMIHTGEYAHVCEICNARFRTAGRFNRHMQKGHVLPVHLNIVEQNDMNTLDDLIEYQPELTPTDLIQSNFEELTQPLPLPSRELLQEDAGFGSEELLDQASRIFTVQCFPNASFSDDTLYSFMD
ncbi:zinc finger protein 552-like [Anopheles nili]|uniref:zinc finger protein 552-like n=1 Tax=Anopheles nili TaxID=185578 RepID=UPI00237A1B0D|nr:zinc finger protein 552-like [Anopheles nili]